MVTPKGTVHKATKTVEDARHEAALKAGAKEVAGGTVLGKTLQHDLHR
jgi:hypothetical protein